MAPPPPVGLPWPALPRAPEGRCVTEYGGGAATAAPITTTGRGGETAAHGIAIAAGAARPRCRRRRCCCRRHRPHRRPRPGSAARYRPRQPRQPHSTARRAGAAGIRGAPEESDRAARSTSQTRTRLIGNGGDGGTGGAGGTGGTVAGARVAPLIERCWPAICKLAGKIYSDIVARHAAVAAALGLSADPATAAHQLALLRGGARSRRQGDTAICARLGYAYTAVGNVLGLYFGDYKAGFRFGQLGLDFVEQPGMDRLKARVYLAFGNLAKPPVRHARTGRPLARDAFEAAQQVGDLTYAGISCNNLLTQLLASGTPLAEVHQEAKAGLDFARRAHFGAVVSLITAQLGLIRTLRGLTPVFGCFNDDGFEEEQFEQQLAAEPSLGIAAFMYWIRKLQARILANDPVAAVAAATKAERLLWMSPVIFERADYHLYAALALIALSEAASDAESAQYQEGLSAHHRQLQAWAEHCPENFVSRAALIGAEIARLNGRELEAERLYEQAIRSARDNCLVHNEALAHEMAARFYAARAFETNSHAHLQNARHCYLRWGADGKVRQLDEMYPNLRTERGAAGPTGKIEAPIDQLDLATVVKVSQAVSSEIQFEKLIETLLKVALEHAGAERGLLILPQGERHRIEAEIKTDLDQVQVQLRHAPITSSELPESVFRYVIRTQQKIILDDASASNMFSEDDYLRQRRPRSILCLPLVKQTKMLGVLYLENNLAPRVFTQKRLAMLELVASQAAISLDHARVYAELAQAEERQRYQMGLLRTVTDNASSMLYIVDAAGLGTFVNPAFERITGYCAEEVLGQILHDKIHHTKPDGTPYPAHECPLIGAVRTGKIVQGEDLFVRKDNTFFPVRCTVSPIFREGLAVGAVIEVQDLTDHKRAEQAWHEAQAQLAHVTRVATLGELAGSIAHEVNQPLTAIINNADACLALLPGEISKLDDVREALSDIISDADRASAVLARIRGLIKKSPPQKSRLDLNETIGGVIALARGVLDRNEVWLRTKLANDLPLIMGDRIQLQQVILNLVINGIEAMSGVSDSPRELWVSSEKLAAMSGELGADEFEAERRLVRNSGSTELAEVLGDPIAAGPHAERQTPNAERAYALVSVADSGPGLDLDNMDRLFDAFYTTKPQGLGMGLSISRSIIGAHGGRLWARANVPKGALFQFTLPIGFE